MTDAEALRYALDWLRAFPALPTATSTYREERAAVVERLDAMLRDVERDEAWVRDVTRMDDANAVTSCADESGVETCARCSGSGWDNPAVALDTCTACDGTGRGKR